MWWYRQLWWVWWCLQRVSWRLFCVWWLWQLGLWLWCSRLCVLKWDKRSGHVLGWIVKLCVLKIKNRNFVIVQIQRLKMYCKKNLMLSTVLRLATHRRRCSRHNLQSDRGLDLHVPLYWLLASSLLPPCQFHHSWLPSHHPWVVVASASMLGEVG